jgi:hypothetical protein
MREGTDEAVKVGRLQVLPVNKISSSHFATRVLPRRGHHFVRLWGDPSIHNGTTDVFATGNTWSNNDALCQERG